MSRYLVGVDSSECTVHAVDRAARLAASTGASLTLLHVVPSVDTPFALPQVPVELMDPVLRAERERLLERLKALAVTYGVDVDTVLTVGDPAQRIVTLSHEEDVEMVVVGSHGRKALERLLVGSVAEGVLHRCEKPVLVVH